MPKLSACLFSDPPGLRWPLPSLTWPHDRSIRLKQSFEFKLTDLETLSKTCRKRPILQAGWSLIGEGSESESEYLLSQYKLYKEIHLGLHGNAKVSLPSKFGISAGFNRPLSWQLLMASVGFLNSAMSITDVWSVFSTLPWQLLMPGRFSQLCHDNYWCLIGFLNFALTSDAW